MSEVIIAFAYSAGIVPIPFHTPTFISFTLIDDTFTVISAYPSLDNAFIVIWVLLFFVTVAIVESLDSTVISKLFGFVIVILWLPVYGNPIPD